jgi:alkylation response protein AidB-like acyl-CoA dehydrogenase
VGFASKEKRAGKALRDHQLVQLKVSEMHALTETLRSFVMRVGWEMDRHVHSANPVLVMNYAQEAIQRVTRLNLDIHAAAGGGVSAMADKLVRDGIIWTHLAGDTTQRLKAVRRIAR